MRAFILAVTGLVLSVAACSSYGTSVVAADKTPVKVASVSVSVPPSLVAGQTGRATATPKDANGIVLQGRTVLWSTSTASVASVTDSGVISAIAPGTTVVSAVSEGVTGQATMAVMSPAPIPVASVLVSPGSASVQVGTTVQLSAVTRDANNNTLTGRAINWSSSNGAVATVSASGLVTAVAAGGATITASSEGQNGTSAVTVTAQPPAPVASVSISPSSTSVQAGSTVQLSVVTRDANNNVLTGRVISWQSGNTAKATVNSSGVVTGVDTGTVQITATSEGVSGTASVTVTAPPPPPPPGSSNEPAGMTLIDERPFNSLNEHAAPYSPAWDTDTNLTIVQDATAPKSPSNVLRWTYPAGFAGGSAPGHTGTAHSGQRVMYISYWGKLSTNFWGHLTAVNKQLYEWANGSNVFYFEARGVGSGTLRPSICLQGTLTDGNYSPNLVPTAEIIRGQWYHVEIVLTGNSSGTADGSVDWWLDGVHVGSRTSLQFTSSATSWGIFEFTPVWGGVTDNVPATMTFDVDHVYLSGKN